MRSLTVFCLLQAYNFKKTTYYPVFYPFIPSSSSLQTPIIPLRWCPPTSSAAFVLLQFKKPTKFSAQQTTKASAVLRNTPTSHSRDLLTTSIYGYVKLLQFRGILRVIVVKTDRLEAWVWMIMTVLCVTPFDFDELRQAVSFDRGLYLHMGAIPWSCGTQNAHMNLNPNHPQPPLPSSNPPNVLVQTDKTHTNMLPSQAIIIIWKWAV